MKRTTLAGIGATVALALTLSACTGGASDPADTSSASPSGSTSAADPANPTTIGFFTERGGWLESYETMSAAATEQVGISLDITPYTEQTAYDTFVRQSFRTDEVPDLFTWSNGGKLEEIVEQGMVAETTEIWAEATANGWVPEGLIDAFTFDGKQYCVPMNVAYWAVYYNKKVFAEHGLEVPTTWAELLEVADVLVDKGVVPFHQMNIVFEFVWFMAMLAGNSPEVYQGILDGTASYLDPEVVEVAEAWRDMMQKGYFLDAGVTTEPQVSLASGEVAMAYFGTFFSGQLKAIDAVAGEDYGIFTMPNFSPDVANRQMVLETGPICAGAGAKNEAAALEYSRWWMSTDAQSVWSADRGEVSFNPQVEVTDPELSALVAEVTGDGAAFTIQQRYLEASPRPVYVLSTEIFGDFVTNAPDLKPGLERLQAEAEAYWAEKK